MRYVSPRKTLAFFTRIASRLVSLSRPIFFTFIYPYDEALFVNQHPRRSDLRHRSDDANSQHASFSVLGFYHTTLFIYSYFFRACGNQPSDEAVRQIEANFPAYKVDSDVHVEAVTLNVSSFLLPKSNYLK